MFKIKEPQLVAVITGFEGERPVVEIMTLEQAVEGMDDAAIISVVSSLCECGEYHLNDLSGEFRIRLLLGNMERVVAEALAGLCMELGAEFGIHIETTPDLHAELEREVRRKVVKLLNLNVNSPSDLPKLPDPGEEE